MKKTIAVLTTATLLMLAIPSAANAPGDTYLICNTNGVGLFVMKPGRCTILPAGASFAEGRNLKGLKWKNWASPIATARGISLGFHKPFSKTKVKIRATGLQLSPCNQESYIYTLLRVKSRYGTGTVKPQRCGGYGE